MSETDALLPVTTGTRQRKTQQVIAARSSIGDTLVEENDGPQISKYGHSHASSLGFGGDEEYEEEGVPRHSTWVHTAFLLLGDIVGTGVLSLAAAFAGFGWIFGIILVVFFALANYHTGTMLHRLCLKHPTAHSYGGLITAVFGDSQLTRIVHKGIYVYLFFFLGDYLMVLALSVQDIFWGWRLCKPIAAAIACGGLLITNQLRTLTHVAIAAVAGFVTIMATIALTLARAGMGADIKYVDDDESHPSTQYLVATPSFVRFTMAITSIIFAYDGQKIYPEFISEMARPEDFRKALNVAQPFLCSVYVIVCCVCYAYYGDSAPHYLLDVLNYNWTRTFAGCLMFVHMIISYTITQQVLTRAIHLMCFPDTVNALHPKDEGYVRGAIHWFGISTALMIGAYVFTGLIPFFGQMNSLIGAVFDPLLCFVLPSIMLYKSGLPMTPIDKVGALFYVFVVGVFAWGPGTGVAIYSIAESSDDVGGPFSCQCIAKQCST